MSTPAGPVRIEGPRLTLRPLRAGEIDGQWQAMVTADEMSTPTLPDEAAFRARLRRSGQMHDGWLDLAIDVGGTCIGRIQTFVPPGRALPPGTYEVGIGLDEDKRGRGYGREALAQFTGWLFGSAGAAVVEAPTDPANVAMRTVFDRVGWTYVGLVSEHDRDWCLYRITRDQWEHRADEISPRPPSSP